MRADHRHSDVIFPRRVLNYHSVKILFKMISFCTDDGCRMRALRVARWPLLLWTASTRCRSSAVLRVALPSVAESLVKVWRDETLCFKWLQIDYPLGSGAANLLRLPDVVWIHKGILTVDAHSSLITENFCLRLKKISKTPWTLKTILHTEGAGA